MSIIASEYSPPGISQLTPMELDPQAERRRGYEYRLACEGYGHGRPEGPARGAEG